MDVSVYYRLSIDRSISVGWHLDTAGVKPSNNESNLLCLLCALWQCVTTNLHMTDVRCWKNLGGF